MTNVRAYVLISGHVHGVFFRGATQRRASALNVTGWVRNLPDGRVEAVFEGTETRVREMIAWCWQGPPNAYVTDVSEQFEPYSGAFRGFGVYY